MIIPHTQLSPEALQGLIDDVATRDGTDYGAVEASVDAKCAQIRRQLESGELQVVFDAETETVAILPPREIQAREQQQVHCSV